MFKHNIRKIGIASVLTMILVMMSMMVSVTATITEEAEVALSPKVTETIRIDGTLTEGVWSTATWYGVARRQEATTLNNTVEFATAWDDNHFYVAIRVGDDNIVTNNLNETIYNNDGVEIYLDPKNLKGEKVYDEKTLHLVYQAADGKWELWGGEKITEDVTAKFPGIQAKHALTADGYVVEAVFPFADLGIEKPWDGTVMGLEITNNDDDDAGSKAATDRGVQYWNEKTESDSPETWGSVCLYNKISPVISYRGTPVIDGSITDSDKWIFSSEKFNADAGISYQLASLCDVDNLYLAIDIHGEDLDASSISLFIDKDYTRGGENEEFIQIVDFSPSGEEGGYTRSGSESTFSYTPNVTKMAVKTEEGYSIEIQIGLSEYGIKPQHLNAIGMEIDYFKTKNNYDSTRTTWSAAPGASMWGSSETFGTILLNNVNVAGGSNNAPEGNQISSYSIAQGQKLSGKITVTDPDGDPLTYTFDPDCKQPSKVYGTFDLNETTGEWVFTPASKTLLAQDGINYYILATDDKGATFHQRVEIRIEFTPTFKTYHVDGDTGNDSNDGSTHEKAFKTIETAAAITRPGDTVIIHESDIPYLYTGYKTLVITNSGLPDAYITYKAAEGEHPVLKSGPTWSTVYMRGSYIKIEGLTFNGLGHEIVHEYEERYNIYKKVYDGANAGTLSGVTRYNTNGISFGPEDSQGVGKVGIDKVKVLHHYEIRNCVFDGMAASGTGGSNIDYITIENNTIVNNCWGNMWACSGITIHGCIDIDDNFDAHKIVVRNNITAGNRHFVPWIDIKRFSDGNGIIIDSTNNVATNSDLLAKGDKYGVQPYQGRILVANNLTYLNGGSGIHVFDGDHVDLINNTVYSNSSTPILGYSDFYASQANDVNMINNIVYSRTGAKMQISSAANSDIFYDYNLFYNYSDNNNLGQNIPGKGGKEGTTAGANNIYGKDPMFKNVYEVNHDNGKPYPNTWTAEMKEFAKNSGYYLDANYSVTDLDYDFGLKEGSPALSAGDKEWSDKIGNTENRMGIFGTIGSSMRPVKISDSNPMTDRDLGEAPQTETMTDKDLEDITDTKTPVTDIVEDDADTNKLSTEEDETTTPENEGSNTILLVIIGCVIGVGVIAAVILVLKKSKTKE